MVEQFVLIAISLVSLLYMSYLDIKFREVPSNIVYVTIAAEIMLLLMLLLKQSIPSHVLYISLAENLFILLLIWFMVKLNLLGEGDLAVFLIICLAWPFLNSKYCLFTPLFSSLFYYTLILVVYMLVNAVMVITLYFKQWLKIPYLAIRLLYLFIARPIRVSEILSKKWWYPLSLCGEYRVTFNIRLDPEDVARDLESKLASGCTKLEDYVWATYGIPAIPIIMLGYLLALLLGDSLIVSLLQAIFRVKPICIS